VLGTHGCIEGDMESETLRVKPFGKPERKIDVASLTRDLAGHGGGDVIMLREFIEMHGSTGRPTPHMTTIEASGESHYIAFAAEKSRKNGGMAVEMKEFRA
jgi:hypothetical protein